MNRGERERETNKQTNHPKIIAHIRTRGNTAAVCVCVYCGSSGIDFTFLKNLLSLLQKDTGNVKKGHKNIRLIKVKVIFLSVKREGIYVEGKQAEDR